MVESAGARGELKRTTARGSDGVVPFSFQDPVSMNMDAAEKIRKHPIGAESVRWSDTEAAEKIGHGRPLVILIVIT